LSGDLLTTAALTAAKSEGFLLQVYGDLARPGVQQVGIALSTVLGLGNTILWPLQLANESAKIALVSNLERLRERLERVKPEHVTPVVPEVGVPVAEKLAYVADPELSQLFVSLLGSAADQRAQSYVHPAFVHVLSCLTPDEARTLKWLRDKRGIAAVRGIIDDDLLCRADPLGEYEADQEYLALLAAPENVTVYLNNLIGLGILEDVDFFGPDTHVEFEDLEESATKRFKAERDETWTQALEEEYPRVRLEFRRCYFVPTSFGHLLIQACGLSSSDA
jgi:hypothetical protein